MKIFPPFPVIFLLLALWISGCASTQSMEVALRSRTLSGNILTASAQPQVIFVSKGVWIVGLRDPYPVGSWVRLVPGDEWPNDEPRPTFLVGRVVEQKQSAVRLEILSLHADLTSTEPAFEVYPLDATPSKNLHAITKKLVFASKKISDDEVSLSITPDEFIEGTEIYGAFSIRDGRRLASQCASLWTVHPESTSDGLVHLKRVVGELPDDAVFVLLDASIDPIFEVEIGVDDDAVFRELEAIQAQNLPGNRAIRLKKTSATRESALKSFGGAQTMRIGMVQFRDGDHVVQMDEGFRVNPSPWRVIVENDDSPKRRALAIYSRALMLLGFSASSAWLLEEAWHEAPNVSSRAAIVPALASSYQQMERGDWSIEIALEMQAEASRTSGRDRAHALAAVTIASAITQNSREFAEIFPQIDRKKLSSSWRHMLTFAEISAKSDETHAPSDVPWNEFDEMIACQLSGDEDRCERDLSKATTEIGRLWFQAFSDDLTSSEGMRLAEAVDRLGAPYLAMRVWQRLTETLPDEALGGAQRAILEYARASQLTRAWLRGESTLFEIHQPNAAAVISALRGYDWRGELARLSIRVAEKSGNDEAMTLYAFASERFIEMGDAASAALALEGLANAMEKAGLSTQVAPIRERALSFKGGKRAK